MKEVWQTNPLTTSVTQTPKFQFELVMLNRGFLVSPSIYFHTVFVGFFSNFRPSLLEFERKYERITECTENAGR